MPASVVATILLVYAPESLCSLQLVPFPFDLVQRELRRYPNAEFLWAQEEPMNMGPYAHIAPRLETCMRNEDREVNLPSCSNSMNYASCSNSINYALCSNNMNYALCSNSMNYVSCSNSMNEYACLSHTSNILWCEVTRVHMDIGSNSLLGTSSALPRLL